MVMKPLRPCNKVGCKNITDKAYCNDHKYIPLKRNKENKRKYDRYYDLYKRDQTSRIFYSSADWQKTREARKAKDNGLCQHCLKENKIVYADMVDHRSEERRVGKECRQWW